MKRIILGALLLLSTLGFSQSKFGLGVNYGTENTIGIDGIYINKYIIGAGVSFNINSYGIGSDYTDNEYTHSFGDQVLQSSDMNKKDLSFYGIGGYKYHKLKIIGKLGYGSKATYNNYYDPSQIFGSNGYYYEKISADGEFLYGGSLGLEVIKNFYLDAGYDNFNGGTFGLSYLFL